MAGVMYPIVLLCVCVFFKRLLCCACILQMRNKPSQFLIQIKVYFFLSDKVLKNKAIKIAIDPKYDDYQRG